ncbi:MAG: hypothetical protein ACD_22C00278G0008 [uncultured bacterium]|nr:MAG: hypothetical protein ACD_22C00278G0008 [uncultured bacterium]
MTKINLPINHSKKVSDDEIRKLVIARLRSLPSGKKISIGSSGEYSKEELIQKVESADEIGQKIVQIQLEYLRSFKESLMLDE